VLNASSYDRGFIRKIAITCRWYRYLLWWWRSHKFG